MITAVQGVAITPVTLVATGGTGTGYTFTATGAAGGAEHLDWRNDLWDAPTVNGTFSYTVTITDSAGNKGTLSCSVTASAPSVTSACAVITAVQGVAITPVTLSASGGTGTGCTFTATGLPAGLGVPTGGTISGTPTVSGTFSYTVTITDSAGNKGTLNCSVTVSAPVTSACAVITAVQGVAITPVTLSASGGTGTGYTFTATGLPTGLSISTGGTIWDADVSGTFSYTVTITDSAGNKGTLNCSVTVSAPVTSACAVIAAVQGVAITPVTLSASGGTGTGYTFAATGLPTGLSISTGGMISGTPTVSGTFSYTVTITDGAGNKGMLNCSVTVSAPVTSACAVITAVQGVAIMR